MECRPKHLVNAVFFSRIKRNFLAKTRKKKNTQMAKHQSQKKKKIKKN
jgi:hypothetical protein